MPRPHHSAGRAVQALTLGVVKATDRRRAREAELGLAETEQQYQLPISGTAGTLPGFATKAIDFDYPFYYAPGQRDSDLEVPHFSHGSEIDGDVAVTASVRSWAIDSDTGGIYGATILVTTMAAIEYVTFDGSVHLRFQGFSAPDDSAEDVGLEQ